MPLSWSQSSRVFIFFASFPACHLAECVPLRFSTSCPNFGNDFFQRDLLEYPFLSGIENVTQFDSALQKYVDTEFPRLKFQQQFGCSSFNKSASWYARFTTTILCASIVQLSQSSCSEAVTNSSTVCAETCAEYARSEAAIASSPTCGLTLDRRVLSEVRADYNLCSIPDMAYATSCVEGLANEPQRCGFGTNTEQLCALCRSGTVSTTNTCCDAIDNTTCEGVPIRPIPSIIILDPPNSKKGPRLKQGAIIAIVICSFLVLLGVMIIIAMFFWKRRRLASLRNRLATLNTQAPPGPKKPAEIVSSSRAGLIPESRNIGATRTLSAYRETLRDSVGTSTSPTTSSSGLQPYRPADSDEEGKAGTSPSGPSRQSFYAQGVAISRSEASLSSSRISRPLSFIDQYSGQKIGVGSVVRCVRDYNPALPDELSCKQGDLIKVTRTYDDRWCRGVVLGPDDTHSAAGAFPIVCVCAIDHVMPGPSQPLPSSQPASMMYAMDSRSTSDRELQILLPVLEEEKREGQQQSEIPNRPSISRFREHVDNGQ